MTDSVARGRRTIGLPALLGALLLGGCTADIKTTNNNNGTTPPSPGPGGGAGGVGVPGGGGGSSGGNFAPATDPGRVTMHRLNLAEYDNTMRDLFGTSRKPSVDLKFPPDDPGADFDNAADTLTTSPLHLSSYNDAASTLIAEALGNPAQRALLLTCDLATAGATCVHSTLETFLPRAWRRPVTPAEVDDLMTLATLATGKGDTAETGLALALRAALLSPNFMFRPELDPSVDSVAVHPLGEYELASRLSYFLWSSMPDAALFDAAKAGSLHEVGNLAGQVVRMLADGKAQALIDNFAGQWLYLRNFDHIQPSEVLFPHFKTELVSAFKTETSLLFREFAFNGMPADQLLTANFTFVNDPLAAYYGLPAPGKSDFVKVDVTAHPERRGFLSNAGVLAANSHPDKSSPVLRGKFVLTQLLCQGVPPPPPEVNTTLAADTTGKKTLRQVLETHLLNPTCASCHSLMDPIGFGMENYDAVGAYRTTDNTLPIDATGKLPGGQTFNGLGELTQLLAKDPEFTRCLSTKLYTYALGRSPVTEDPAHLDPSTLQAITTTFRQKGLKFSDLVSSIITSPTFLNRRGEGS